MNITIIGAGNGETFETLDTLEQAFKSYVWWYNNKRLHSSLGYQPPIYVA